MVGALTCAGAEPDERGGSVGKVNQVSRSPSPGTRAAILEATPDRLSTAPPPIEGSLLHCQPCGRRRKCGAVLRI